MQFIGYGIAFLIGALAGGIGMFLTVKETDIIQGYEIRISALESENARLRAEQELNIDDSMYQPENMNKKSAKELLS